MIKQRLILLLALLLMVILGLWYLQDLGSITITWIGYEIQFSILTGVILFLVFYFLFSIFLSSLFCIHNFILHTLSYFQGSKKSNENSEDGYDH